MHAHTYSHAVPTSHIISVFFFFFFLSCDSRTRALSEAQRSVQTQPFWEEAIATSHDDGGVEDNVLSAAAIIVAVIIILISICVGVAVFYVQRVRTKETSSADASADAYVVQLLSCDETILCCALLNATPCDAISCCTYART
jgi:ABC-type phosphate transport system permease subunit